MYREKVSGVVGTLFGTGKIITTEIRKKPNFFSSSAYHLLRKNLGSTASSSYFSPPLTFSRAVLRLVPERENMEVIVLLFPCPPIFPTKITFYRRQNYLGCIGV